MRRLPLLSLLLLTACSSGADSAEEADTPAEASPADNAATVEALRVHCAELLERPEIEAEEVEVQHILIAFDGAERSKATRSKAEAEALAAELYERILAGEDFDGLVKEYTDDSHPGIYAMTLGPRRAGVYPRGQMVAAFGDTGWRLAVGQVGVAAWHEKNSPFGWHIVKRTR